MPDALETGTGQDLEERFKGVQRLAEQRLRETQEAQARAAVLEAQIEESRLASLPTDQRETLLIQRKRAELADLDRQIAIKRLEQEYPDAAGDARRLFAAPTIEEQFKLLESLRHPERGTQSPPEIDLNNPIRTPSDQQLWEGVQMNDDLANQILRGGIGR